MKRLLVFVLSLFLSTGFALTKVNLALDWYINPDHAPILAAETQGYFKQNGLAVHLIEPSQNATARNLVVVGDATIGLDYEPEMLLAIHKGMPIKKIGTLIPVPLSCIAVLQSSGVKSLKDLKGKSIGYSGNALEAKVLKTELQHAGLNPQEVTLVPIHMDLTQALLSKTVVAVSGMMRNVEPVMLKMRGVNTRLFYPEQNGVPPHSELVFIAKKNIDPKITAAFLKSIQEGVAYVKAHPEQSWQAAESAYHDDLATSKTIANANHAIWLVTIPYFANNPSERLVSQEQSYQKFMLNQQ